MTTRTVVFPLELTETQQAAVLETLELYIECWTACIDTAWAAERPSRVPVHKAVYSVLRARLGLKAQLVCSAIDRAIESVKSSRALAARREQSAQCRHERKVAKAAKSGKRVKPRKPIKATKPRARGTIPIRLDARTLSFDKPREKASFTTQQGRVKAPLVWHAQAKRYRDWGCKSGEVGLDRKGRFVLRLHFEKDVTLPGRTDRVVGVDMGINNPVVASDNRFVASDRKGRWKAHERKLLVLRSRLQSKGTPSAKRHLKKLSGRLRRFRIDCDRVLAKELLSGLTPGDTVVLEDLTGLRESLSEKKHRKANKEQRKRLGLWAYARRAQTIRDRAALQDLYVEQVEPCYTSLRCPACGKLARRKGWNVLVCPACSLELNADLAAARNIEFLWRSASDAASGLPVNQPVVRGSVKSTLHPAYKLSPSGDSR